MIQGLPVALSQAIVAPLQTLINERIMEMAKAVADKELEQERAQLAAETELLKAKHEAELQQAKHEAELQQAKHEAELQKTKSEVDSKLKDQQKDRQWDATFHDMKLKEVEKARAAEATASVLKIREMQKKHELELEAARHEADKLHWELRASGTRQEQRVAAEAAIPPGQHADLKAATCRLIMYHAPQRMDPEHFNAVSKFVKACSSVLVDRREGMWIGLLHFEGLFYFDDAAMEIRNLARKDAFTGPVFLEDRISHEKSTKLLFEVKLLEKCVKGDCFSRESRRIILDYIGQSKIARKTEEGVLFPFAQVSD